jgi:uncharacterized DUF497 family protein
MRFEWDIEKATRNLKKHKVAFSEAETVFGDPLSKILIDELHSGEERREWIIGHSSWNRLLIVSFTERENDTIRIISTRLATLRERQDYEKER